MSSNQRKRHRSVRLYGRDPL